MAEAGSAETAGTSLYDLFGGAEGVRRLVDHFYDVMDEDPAARGVRAMHEADLGRMRGMLADWFSGALGGPPLYAQRPDRGCMVSVHRAFPIGPEERDQWMACMRQAFDRAGLSTELREALDGPLFQLADRLRTF
jgi:hemoglobin